MSSKNMKLNPQPLALSLAIWSSLLMLILWVLANMGLYASAVDMMLQWHIFFDLTLVGLIGGVIEAAISSYVGMYAFVYIYNAVASK